ncbi:MAG: cobalamin biosynthesis protein CobD [Rhizorhabdus sp.]|nr:cobalamin biosynthesis protein CobD [Rhizorhabdus sp.]
MTIGQAGQLLAILPIEAALGYPAVLLARFGHPVTWLGGLIVTVERRWNQGSDARRRVAGIGLLVLLMLVAGVPTWLLARWVGQGWGLVLVILIGTTGLAQRSLHDHVAAVLRPLAAGDLDGARRAVAMIVGRDTDALNEGGVAVAAIESLAESFCDGVVAPAFWYLVAGLPGLMICKAINTADSIVGHRDARYAAFGWGAARADDLVNLVPARLAGLLICLSSSPARGGGLSAGWWRGASERGAGPSTGFAGPPPRSGEELGGWRTMFRDATRHASPNGGWPEAAMAGVLGRRLGGPVFYDGEPAERALLGDGPSPDAADLRRALVVYRWACLLLWLIVGGVAWLR